MHPTIRGHHVVLLLIIVAFGPSLQFTKGPHLDLYSNPEFRATYSCNEAYQIIGEDSTYVAIDVPAATVNHTLTRMYLRGSFEVFIEGSDTYSYLCEPLYENCTEDYVQRGRWNSACQCIPLPGGGWRSSVTINATQGLSAGAPIRIYWEADISSGAWNNIHYFENEMPPARNSTDPNNDCGFHIIAWESLHGKGNINVEALLEEEEEEEEEEESTNGGGKTSKGKLIGGLIGGLSGVVVTAVIVFVVVKNKKKGKCGGRCRSDHRSVTPDGNGNNAENGGADQTNLSDKKVNGIYQNGDKGEFTKTKPALGPLRGQPHLPPQQQQQQQQQQPSTPYQPLQHHTTTHVTSQSETNGQNKKKKKKSKKHHHRRTRDESEEADGMENSRRHGDAADGRRGREVELHQLTSSDEVAEVSSGDPRGRQLPSPRRPLPSPRSENLRL